jgi:hypothetical protein
MKAIGHSKAWEILTYRLYDGCANIFRTDGMGMISTFGPLKKGMV